MISNQKSGDDSMNLQAGRDIVVNNGNSIALYSIEEVAKQLLGSVFGELPDETKKQIETNQKSYFQSLSENLSKIIKQNEELKTVINSPDFQYVSKHGDFHCLVQIWIGRCVNFEFDKLHLYQSL